MNLVLDSEDGKVIYKVVLISESTEYTFCAKVSKQFFKENIENLLGVDRSLRVLESRIPSIQFSNTLLHNSNQSII